MLEYFVKLTPAEVRQFIKFAASPYFNENRKVVLLCNYLSSRYPNLTPEVLNKKIIYRFVYRNQKYNDANYRKLVSDFNTVFKRFLAELELEESTQLKKRLLLKRYNKLNIPEKVKHIYRETIHLDSNFFEKDLQYYFGLFETEFIYYYYIFHDSKEKIKSFERLSKYADWLIIYMKLALYNFESNLIFIKPREYKLNYALQQEIYNLVEKHIKEIKKNHPEMFFMYCNCRIKNDSSYFPELEKYYDRNKKLVKGKLFEEYLESYFQYYYEIFMSSTHREKENASKKLFRYLNYYYFKNDPIDAVKNGIYISTMVLIAAVNVAVYLDRLNWAEEFIEKNKNYLPEDSRKEDYSIVKATIQLHKKDYKSALDSFSNITGKDVQNDFSKRIGTIIIYYEMKDFEGIKSQLVNLRTFKNNKKTTELIVSIMKNFLKYFNMLMKIRSLEKNKRREEIIMFRDKLEKENKWILKRKWFMEKIEEL